MCSGDVDVRWVCSSKINATVGSTCCRRTELQEGGLRSLLHLVRLLPREASQTYFEISSLRRVLIILLLLAFRLVAV